MGFRIVSGPMTTEHVQKKASQTFAYNDAVEVDSNGYLVPCTSSSAVVYGFIDRAVLATDADYAKTNRVPVVLNTENTEVEFDVGAGTLAVTNQGEYIDLQNAQTVNAGASSTDIMYVTRFISTTKGVGKLAHKAYNA